MKNKTITTLLVVIIVLMVIGFSLVVALMVSENLALKDKVANLEQQVLTTKNKVITKEVLITITDTVKVDSIVYKYLPSKGKKLLTRVERGLKPNIGAYVEAGTIISVDTLVPKKIEEVLVKATKVAAKVQYSTIKSRHTVISSSDEYITPNNAFRHKNNWYKNINGEIKLYVGKKWRNPQSLHAVWKGACSDNLPNTLQEMDNYEKSIQDQQLDKLIVTYKTKNNKPESITLVDN